MKKDKCEIGKNIKILRTTHNYSQKEFADLIGTTQTSLSLYETGSKIPPSEILLKIASSFDVSLDWLCNNKISNHFMTGQDVIDMFLELRGVFNYNITASKCKLVESNSNGEVLYNYLTEIQITTQKPLRDKTDLSDDYFDEGDFTDFFEEFNDLQKKLKTIDDIDIRKNYYELWMEKKRQFYTKLRVFSDDWYTQALIENWHDSIDKSVE